LLPHLSEFAGQTTLATIVLNRVINLQRVLIIENNLLLGAGIQNLLAGTANLDVIGISSRKWPDLVQEIERLQPEVIVLDEASHRASLTKLLPLLKEFPQLRLVVVSANDNRIHIYGKQEILITVATQLINIISK